VTRRRVLIGVWTVAVALTAAASTAGGLGSADARRPPGIPHVPGIAAIGGYERAVDAAREHGLHVWIESDLVRRWLAGPAAFRAGVERIGALARRPGVVGVKIADELGYHDGLDSADQAERFLADSASALRAAAPGKLLLVDMVVPALGCLPGQVPSLPAARDCADLDTDFPSLRLSAVDRYVRSGDMDVLDLSTGLRTAETYRDWGVDVETAQRDAWQEALRRGWADSVRLQARKALAHPNAFQGSRADAQATVNLFVDIPLAEGAAAVDIWTWRQAYQGNVVRLTDPGLRANDLWQALADRRATGAQLFTHLSPQALEVNLGADLRMLSQVFTDLFVAAGTG
jgi:hypothetical protein